MDYGAGYKNSEYRSCLRAFYCLHKDGKEVRYSDLPHLQNSSGLFLKNELSIKSDEEMIPLYRMKPVYLHCRQHPTKDNEDEEVLAYFYKELQIEKEDASLSEKDIQPTRPKEKKVKKQMDFSPNYTPQVSRRNSFVALCEYASLNNWCWKIFCTTCGHGSFRVGFAKLINDEHPDDSTFWPNGKENDSLFQERNEYGEFFGNPRAPAQMKLATIVAEAKIIDIQAVAKYPDWLGYLGLVINHCPDRGARKIISDAFLPQFIDMLNDDKDSKDICDYLKEKHSKQEILGINDLSRIESKKADLKNPPRPLIFDIL